MQLNHGTLHEYGKHGLFTLKMTPVPYTTLSEEVKKLSNPQRSDAFVRQVREAIRTGEVQAAQVPGRFTLPKTYRKRGSEETGTRDARELVIELSPEYQAWFTQVNAELEASPARSRSGHEKPTLETIESGAVEFKTLAEETRRKMQASFEKGQQLGKSRSQAKGAKTKATRGRTTKAKK